MKENWKYAINIISLFMGLFILNINSSLAQPEEMDSGYLNVLKDRTAKIIRDLKLGDMEKAQRVQEIMIMQYCQLSKIHDLRDKKIQNIEEHNESESELQCIENEINSALYHLHAEYLAKLSSELSNDLIEKIKDGMTYGVTELTYSGYLTLLPGLTEVQKRFIYKNLIEAREFAMDAGSAEEKHAWFGKYKGRINNFLSSEGYDLKEAENQLKNLQAN